jgi:hypothetical protein
MALAEGAPYDPVMHHTLAALAQLVTMLAGMVGSFTAIFAGLWASRRAELTVLPEGRRAGRSAP